MAKLKKKCWEESGWERGEQLRDKEGNQAHTFLARRASDPAGEFNYILKMLKRQESPEKRAMFCAETMAMSALDHPGVLPIEETNAAEYRNELELFLITKRVCGSDLSELVATGVAVDQILEIILGVLDILKHCHSRNIVHRDIKPCHVIIREGKWKTPVLIDFGLARSAESQPSEAETIQGDGRGNRFLIGPEHQPGTTYANRNSVTDVCQCVGLLFYALTGREPGLLQDENGLKPHERSGVNYPSTLPDWKVESLIQIFDIGFNWHPDKRWPSSEQLSERIDQLLTSELGPEDQLQLRVQAALKASNVKCRVSELNVAHQMADEFDDLVVNIVETISNSASEYLSLTCQVHKERQSLQGFASFGGFGAGMSPTQAVDTKLLSSVNIRLQPKHPLTTAKEVVTRTGIANGKFITYLCPFTGGAKIFPQGAAVELERSALGDMEAVRRQRGELERLLLELITEILSGGEYHEI